MFALAFLSTMGDIAVSRNIPPASHEQRNNPSLLGYAGSKPYCFIQFYVTIVLAITKKLPTDVEAIAKLTNTIQCLRQPFYPQWETLPFPAISRLQAMRQRNNPSLLGYAGSKPYNYAV